MYNARIHYRSVFTVKLSSQSQQSSIFQVIIGHVGRWLKNHLLLSDAQQLIFKPWLYEGGQITGYNNARIEVKTQGYNDSSRTAAVWVMRFTHNDSKFVHRRWVIDLALVSENMTEAQFSTTVKWYLREDYLGQEPEIPTSSVPRIVRNILEDFSIASSIGIKKLQSKAHKMLPGDGRSLYQYLTSKDRIVPVVLINQNIYNNIIKADGIQNLILGSGIVYWYDNSDIHNELIYEWGNKADQYQCGPDAVRVYLPNLDTLKWSDWKRHRYFKFLDYKDNGADLLNIICQSAFRISLLNVKDHISNFESLDIFNQKQRLKTLREAAFNHKRSYEEEKYVSALEEDNTQMAEEIKQLKCSLTTEEEKAFEYEIKLEETQSRLTTIEKQFDDIAKNQGHFSIIQDKFKELRTHISRIPTNLFESLRLLGDIYPDKVIILNEAYHAAKVSKFQNAIEAWNLLISMVDVLHKLYFEGNSGNIENEFKNETGYEITLKESSMTKADNKLMTKRKRQYEDIEIDISAHTKHEKAGKNLRIHYYPDNKKKLLVIGHCGDHLETAGTQRRKED